MRGHPARPGARGVPRRRPRPRRGLRRRRRPGAARRDLAPLPPPGRRRRAAERRADPGRGHRPRAGHLGASRVLANDVRIPSGASRVIENWRTMARSSPSCSRATGSGGSRATRPPPRRAPGGEPARTARSPSSRTAPRTPRTSSTRSSPARSASSSPADRTSSTGRAPCTCGRPRATGASTPLPPSRRRLPRPGPLPARLDARLRRPPHAARAGKVTIANAVGTASRATRSTTPTSPTSSGTTRTSARSCQASRRSASRIPTSATPRSPASTISSSSRSTGPLGTACSLGRGRATRSSRPPQPPSRRAARVHRPGGRPALEGADRAREPPRAPPRRPLATTAAGASGPCPVGRRASRSCATASSCTRARAAARRHLGPRGRRRGAGRRKRRFAECAGAAPAQALETVTTFVRTNIAFEPGTTGVTTSALEALNQGGGVCEDFAHLIVALLRQLSIPARSTRRTATRSASGTWPSRTGGTTRASRPCSASTTAARSPSSTSP